jgi:endonuclease/exonuclease/phosphatase family metal-dependent hydrolase
MRLAAGLLAALLIAGPRPAGAAARDVSLRVMTYNIHSCKGRDGKIRPDRIAEVIRQAHPDVVALQEIRVGRVDPKTVDDPTAAGAGVAPPTVGESPLPPPTVIPPRSPSETAGPPVPFTDQPRAIAQALGMGYIFYPLFRTGAQDYGIAILSRHPIQLIRAANLPVLERRLFSEKRGAIWAEVTVDGVPVQLVGTHLGLNRTERLAQVEKLLGPDWLASPKFNGPFVLCGDLNSRPSQPPYRKLAAVAQDAPLAADGDKVRSTWPSMRAFFRIDHIFVPKNARPLAAEVLETPLARVSSDHLPLVADVLFRRPAPERREIGVAPRAQAGAASAAR